MKRNVTVTLDEETARWVRVEAARADVSVSQYLGELLLARRDRVEGYEEARAAFMGRPARVLRGRATGLPPRDELHERGSSGRGRTPDDRAG